MNNKTKIAFGICALLLAGQAAAQITFYQGEGFRGRSFTTGKPVNNFERTGFNDAVSSIIVDRGRWEVCSDANFGGRCVVLRAGNYGSLNTLGLNNRISSVRPVGGRSQHVEVPPPPPAPVYEYRQRPSEKLFEVPVTSVHAVMSAGGRKCWVERQQVAESPRGEPNVGGAIIGGIIGGVLGHQIGGGRGNDVATAGGAVAGAVVGSNVGREGGVATRDVRRCEKVSSGPPEYWDVTYRFRNVDHVIQMSSPPGRTVWVNGRGEPRQ
jgi:uncharacterized protein YcfJ